MLPYPHIDPVLYQIGPVKIRWYGLMYLIGFVVGWALAVWRARRSDGRWTEEMVSDVIFYTALGVILGGRIGYVLFYDFAAQLHDPLFVFKTWEGGMSFHGGLLGVLVALAVWCRIHKQHFWDVTDFIAPLVPIGLGAGRLGNFINGELWGKVTDVPWAMVFPFAGPQPRHPSQLYECLLEGVVLFAGLWWYSAKPRPRAAVSAWFLIGYALCRCTVEFFRQPDPQYGYLAFSWLTMGQLLSVPMFLLGVWLLRFYVGSKQ